MRKHDKTESIRRANISLERRTQIIKEYGGGGMPYDSNYAGGPDDAPWYEVLEGVDKLEKYPQDFIDWLNQEDTWAETYVRKYNITKLVTLFDLWVNETY